MTGLFRSMVAMWPLGRQNRYPPSPTGWPASRGAASDCRHAPLQRADRGRPRSVGCAKPVPGGKLIITAKEIEDYGRARLVLRIKLKTSLGDRQYSRDVNLSLIP